MCYLGLKVIHLNELTDGSCQYMRSKSPEVGNEEMIWAA